jgi:DNA polymerase elongation subunit (family B)
LTFKGKKQIAYEIVGVDALDYLELYQWYAPGGRNVENYKLETIASNELDETKLSYDEYDNLHQLYKLDYQKFIDYNIKDVHLVLALEDKLKLIELVLTVAYEAKINYESVSSPVKTWDAIISNYCLDQGVVLPQQRREPAHSLDGAYVKEPIPGWYYNVVSLDALSLYPSIIMTNNISPETYLGKIDMDIDTFLKKPDHGIDSDKIITPVGAIYDRTKRGILPVLVEHFMKLRRDAKNEMLRLEQELELIEQELKSRNR